MYTCLIFAKQFFPGLDNVRMWLAGQYGPRRALMGDLATRGKYSLASAQNGKAWFVFRFEDIKAGKVPRIAHLNEGEEIEQGVRAYADNAN